MKTKSAARKNLNLDYKILTHFLPHEYSYAQKIRGAEILKYAKGGNMLDVGAGCGWLLRYADKKGIKAVGIDIADKVIKENKWFDKFTRYKAKIKKGSVYKIPFPDKSFDLVVVSEVLEHLENPKKAMREVGRVLKKNGRFILLIPGYSYNIVYDKIFTSFKKFGEIDYDTRMNKKLSPYKLSHKKRWEDHHRFTYTTSSLKDLISLSGFKVEKFENSEFLSPFINTVFCNLLGIKREKMVLLEKADVFLLGKVPLVLGSDWMITSKKI